MALQAVTFPLILTALVPQEQRPPSIKPVRLADTAIITIDGNLDEEAWAAAAKLSPLTQVQPVEGARPSRRTEVRLCYDRDSLYLAFTCFDDPDEVRGRIMARDARLDADDRVEFWIDTFHDRRFAFWFQIGAGGSKGDALIADNGSRFNKSWDGIWYGKSAIDGRGWRAEIAIPFKTLSFHEGLSTWGFNLVRHRKANDEELRWAAPYVAHRFFRLSVGGTLEGLSGMRQGIGLELIPYVKASASRDRSLRKHTSRLGETGTDLYYRVSTAMRFALTLNTDFAETEVDQRRVNLTRFPLFFPEKRDFFLEDAGLFEFGPSSPRGRSPDLIPFFSRRIGRTEAGDTLPILAGSKLTGRVGGWNIGALGTYTGRKNAIDERGLGVLRVSRNVGRESALGVILTAGHPEQPVHAVTGGVDFAIGDTIAFGPSSGYKVWGFWLGSQRSGAGGDGEAYALEADFNSTNWSHRSGLRVIGSEFDPALGFLRRSGVRIYRHMSRYVWRDDGFIRGLTFQVTPSLTTLTDGSTDTWSVPLRWVRVDFDSGDEIELRTTRSFERLREDFEIREGVSILPGRYPMTRHMIELEASNRRALSGELRLEHGDFFSGSITKYSIEPSLLTSRHVQLSASYEESRVRLNEGRFTTRVTQGRLDLLLSPEMAWRNLVQYDTDSKNLGLQSRFRWILEPGRELFLLGVYGWQRAAHAAPLIPTMQDLTLKVAFTLRF